MPCLQRERKWIYAAVAVMYAILALAVGKMLLIQAADPLAGDFYQHLESARDPASREYSLFNTIYQWLDRIFHGDMAIIVFIVVVVLAGVWLCGLFFKRYSPVQNPLAITALSMACYCADPIFIEQLNPYRSLGVQAGGVWHNPTLLGIKTMLLALVLLYLKVCEYTDPNKPFTCIKWLVAFSAVLMIATWIKPNLATSVEPAIAFFILFDLCRQKGKGFWRFVALAATVLPSFVVIGWQFLMSFTGAVPGEESGIAFAPGMALLIWTKHPIWAIFQSLAFPLLVVSFSIPKVFTDRKYGFAWAITGFAYVQYLFLAETGKRAGDGNFSWGMQMVMVYLFAASFIRLLEAAPELWKKVWGKILVSACVVLFAWHVFCGVQYIVLFIQNKTYFM